MYLLITRRNVEVVLNVMKKGLGQRCHEMKSVISTFPIVVLRFRGCEVVGPSYSVSCFIHIPGKLGFCSHYYCAVYFVCNYIKFISIVIITVQPMMYKNNRAHYGLQVVFVCLHIYTSHFHHYGHLKAMNI